MQLARKVRRGRLLPVGQLAQGVVGVIAIGVIDSTRRSSGRRLRQRALVEGGLQLLGLGLRPRWRWPGQPLPESGLEIIAILGLAIGRLATAHCFVDRAEENNLH